METKGILKETIRMAWPAVLESFFVSLAAIIDTFMVSSLGTSGVASVGLTTQPKFIALAIFMSCNIAVSALVARRRGQGRQDEANELLKTALWFTIIGAITISAITVLGADIIIQLCGSNADTHAGGVEYFRIIQGGMIFNVVSLVINAAQRGSGNTRIAMTTNVTSSIVNVIFNYLLIGGNFGFPALGLTGAALATVLGTVVACVMSIISMTKKDSYISLRLMKEHKIRATWDSFMSIMGLSGNFLLENIAMRVGFVTTAVIAAKLGTAAFAAHQVGMNIISLSFAFGDGMQVSAVALIGRSLGERDPEKAKRYGGLCQKIGLGISACIAAVMWFFGRTIFSLFFAEPEVINMGVIISYYIMVITAFQISQVIYGGCLRGAGDVKYTLFASLISVTIVRTAVTWLLTGGIVNLGLHGIWIGILSDQFMRFLFMSIRFKQGAWVGYNI